MPYPTPDVFDVVDEHDRVLHQETRAEVHRRRLLHRAVHILVFNSRGDIYAQCRSATKDTYPGRWTTSCSGHVDAGEDYNHAAFRELAEELGLELPPASSATAKHEALNPLIVPFVKYPPCRDTGWEFIWIYSLITDAPITPDPAEVSEGRWLSPAGLDAWMLAEPRAFTPSFLLVWKLWREKNPR
jgi:isopentenyl-diphosphate delta-isomerase type 1